MADELYHFGEKKAQVKSDLQKARRSQTKSDNAQAAYSQREFQDAKTRLNLETGKMISGQLAVSSVQQGAIFAAAFGGLKLHSEVNNNRYVEQYRKDHPDTKLSANEILKMRDSGHAKR